MSLGLVLGLRLRLSWGTDLRLVDRHSFYSVARLAVVADAVAGIMAHLVGMGVATLEGLLCFFYHIRGTFDGVVEIRVL